MLSQRGKGGMVPARLNLHPDPPGTLPRRPLDRVDEPRQVFAFGDTHDGTGLHGRARLTPRKDASERVVGSQL